MHKKLFFVIFALLLSNNRVFSDGKDESYTIKELFPLKAENIWVYKHYQDETFEGIDTLKVLWENCDELECRYGIAFGERRFGFVYDGRHLTEYCTYHGTESWSWLWESRFGGIEEDGAWKSSTDLGNYYSCEVKRKNEVETPYKTFRNCILVTCKFYDTKGKVSSIVSCCYVPKIGLVRYVSNARKNTNTWNLISYKLK